MCRLRTTVHAYRLETHKQLVLLCRVEAQVRAGSGLGEIRAPKMQVILVCVRLLTNETSRNTSKQLTNECGFSNKS